MGLDSVELVISVEEHFQIAIPDDDAAKIQTVGQLHEYVVAELSRLKRGGKGYTQVFEELKAIICRQLGVDPRLVQPEAHFVRDLRLDQ